jgi:hypothetical protein
MIDWRSPPFSPIAGHYSLSLKPPPVYPFRILEKPHLEANCAPSATSAAGACCSVANSACVEAEVKAGCGTCQDRNKTAK